MVVKRGSASQKLLRIEVWVKSFRKDTESIVGAVIAKYNNIRIK